MARLRAFGSKARGSVGATTYYVVNGQQIAREKSVEVKNPKTAPQAAQRMKLAPAQKFYEAFNGVIDHSWQSVKYGNASRQKFMSEAMKQNGGPYVVKGYSTLVPGTYLVSDGSLPEIRCKFINDEENLSTSLQIGTQEIVDQRLPIMDGILNYNPDMQQGDKITMLAVFRSTSNNQIFYTRSLQFIIRPELEPGETDDFELLSGFGAIVNIGGFLSFDLTIQPFNFESKFYACAFAFIHSRGTDQNNDKRSRARFFLRQEIYDLYYSESAYKLALASYQNTTTAPLGAEWYLNNYPAGTIGRVVLKNITILGTTYNVLALLIQEAGANETFILVNGNDRPYDSNGQVINDAIIESTTATLPYDPIYLQMFSGN